MLKFGLSVILSMAIFFAPVVSAEVETPNSQQCEITLRGAPIATVATDSAVKVALPRKLLNALLVFPVPYTPLKDAIRDTNKRFYLFIEKPTLGVFATAVGVSLARFLSPSQSSWVGNFTDSYVSFTMKDIIGSGVAINENLNGAQKYWVNYLYTIGSYSVVTLSTAGVWASVNAVLAHPQTASLDNINGAAYAIGLVAYSVAWPLISQIFNTTLMPQLLLNRFMQKQDLANADTTKNPDSRVVYQQYEKQLKQLAENPTPKNLKTAKYLRYRYMWVKWRREGLKKNDLNPFTGRIVKHNYKRLTAKAYWFLKTAVISTVASSMIIGYFALRNYAVGTSPRDAGAFTHYVDSRLMNLKDREINTDAAAIMVQTPPKLLPASAQQ